VNETELARLLEENELLRQEVRVAREAANLTANVVVQQFEETERVLGRLSQISAEQRAVLDAASQVAVIAADREGTIRLFNTGAERMLGHRASEMIGKATPADYRVAAELAERARTLEAEAGRALAPLDVFLVYAATGRHEAREWTFVRKDGVRVPVDESVTPLRDASGELTGFLCVALDLTVHKRAEQEIRSAMEATEAANRTKSAFLANMSHELRTPLNAIIGYSEMLTEEAEDDGLDHFASDLKKIRDAGQHLLGLINDVLDISKIESGKIELFLEDVVVADLVGEVERMVAPLVEKNGNVIEVACPADVGTMRVDALRLRQILFNLLSNATKFTEHGKVTLRVAAEPGIEGDLVCFHVGDTGIGMTVTQMSRLFQPFVQADPSTTRKYGGTGLGLAISRQFAELMGGAVDVTSQVGRGTTFTVRLPRAVERKAAAPAPPRRAPDPVTLAGTSVRAPLDAPVDEPSGSVLVVDDDGAVRELLAHHLERAGYRVMAAATGDEGLALARAERPDVITLDVLMPGKDGWTVLSELKSSPATVDIPVVMITILDQRNAGFALGAADYLVKPVDRSRLLRVLERHTAQGGAPRSALVVDDDAGLRSLLVGSLCREGYRVREASDGAEALARVAEEVPSVILLDLMMPVMDGFAFLEHLRAKQEWRAVPVVVVTAMELSEKDRLFLNGYVEKVVAKGSYRPHELLGEVERLVGIGMAWRQRKTAIGRAR
jgi:hypothetical protein